MCDCLLHTPNWEPGLQLVCPRLGIKPATLWFTGQHSVPLATPARAQCMSFEIIPFPLHLGQIIPSIMF